jgi:hypothetical protein
MNKKDSEFNIEGNKGTLNNRGSFLFSKNLVNNQ